MYQKVAQVEMRHLHLLGQLITALGGNPIYRSYPYKRPAFGSSGVLQYQGNKEKALHISIAGEQEAVESYRHVQTDSGLGCHCHFAAYYFRRRSTHPAISTVSYHKVAKKENQPG